MGSLKFRPAIILASALGTVLGLTGISSASELSAVRRTQASATPTPVPPILQMSLVYPTNGVLNPGSPETIQAAITLGRPPSVPVHKCSVVIAARNASGRVVRNSSYRPSATQFLAAIAMEKVPPGDHYVTAELYHNGEIVAERGPFEVTKSDPKTTPIPTNTATPAPALFVTDNCSQGVMAFPAATYGDISPLAPAPTGLSKPQFVAIDKNSNIYATNACTRTITIYAEGSKGIAAPTAIIGGTSTGLSSPEGIAVDSDSNIYVADFNADSVFVYSAGSSGDAAPLATITGDNTDLNAPTGIALDSTGNIYVTNGSGNSVTVFAPLASSSGTLNEAPIAIISGTSTDLGDPQGIALDSNDKIYVADGLAPKIFVYPALGGSGWVSGPPATYTVAPAAIIAGTTTDLANPIGVGLDSNNKIYVADVDTQSVYVFPALGSSSGTLDEAPTYTIRGSSTALSRPQGVALDSSRNIYVASQDTSSVTVYSPVGSTTGTLNEAPSSAISAAMTTDLIYPQGVALDSSGNIYVAGETYAANYAVSTQFPPAVYIYAAGSNGNEAPTASISGLSTELSDPQGITLDFSNNVYVADAGAGSVFVYAAGKTGDVAPLATISGSNTKLVYPEGIALDSSGNIYVTDSGAEGVAVFPALGQSKGVLNEAPTATIGGGTTGLDVPTRHRAGFQRQHLCGGHP